MNKSFKTPAGLLANAHLDVSLNAGNHIGKSADGAPIQPMLPSGYPMPKMVEREITGVQCPSDNPGGGTGCQASPELVH